MSSQTFSKAPTLARAFQTRRAALSKQFFDLQTSLSTSPITESLVKLISSSLGDIINEICSFPVLYKANGAPGCNNFPPCFVERIPRLADNIRALNTLLNSNVIDTIYLTKMLQSLSIMVACLAASGPLADENTASAIVLARDYMDLLDGGSEKNHGDMDKLQLTEARKFWDHMKIRKKNCSCTPCSW